MRYEGGGKRNNQKKGLQQPIDQGSIAFHYTFYQGFIIFLPVHSPGQPPWLRPWRHIKRFLSILHLIVFVPGTNVRIDY